MSTPHTPREQLTGGRGTGGCGLSGGGVLRHAGEDRPVEQVLLHVLLGHDVLIRDRLFVVPIARCD